MRQTDLPGAELRGRRTPVIAKGILKLGFAATGSGGLLHLRKPAKDLYRAATEASYRNAQKFASSICLATMDGGYNTG